MPREDQRLEERRRAGLEHLENGETRCDPGVLGREGALEDEDAVRHPNPERYFVPASPQERLGQVNVAVHEPRHDEPSVEIPDPRLRESASDLGRLAYRFD